jgi:hypothetical protein
LTKRAEKALIDETPRPSSAPPRGYGRGSVRSKATRVLLDAPGAILPHTRRSFVDRKYSPSTSMDQSDWEIILEELTGMVYNIKEEPVSEAND